MDVKAGSGTSATNPNVLFSECLKLVATAERCAAAAMRNRERVRRSLYRAAVKYQQLARDHHEWFLAQARSVGGIDALLEGWFRPLALFGEDWRDLLRDVAEGMTEREYMASTAGSFLRRRRVAALVNRQAAESPLPTEPERGRAVGNLASREPADSPLPSIPEPSLPVEERVVLLEEQNCLLRQQLTTSRKEASELRRIAARQERRIAELEGLLNRVEKAVSRRKAG